jgi:hypothetical protein
MALKVTSVQLRNEFNGVITNWLKHLKGEKINFAIEFCVQTAIKIFDGIDISNKLEYAPSSFLTLDYITVENASTFFEFYVGDTINIVDVDQPGNNGDYLILEKPNNSTLRLSSAVTAGISSNAIIKVIDVVDKVKMRFNFIENNEAVNWNSKVDGNIMEIEASGLIQGASGPYVDFVYNGSKSWQMGSAKITPNGYNAEGFPLFKILGNFTLLPFITFDQWDNVVADIPPPYFYDFNCLKLVYRIEASYVGRSPYINQAFQDSLTEGDSGTYSEEFNNTPTNFELYSFQILDVDSNPVDELEATTDEQSFTAVVKNTIDTPFDVFTKFLVQFYIAPETLDEYKNNGHDVGYNFRHDRALQLVAATAINGDKYGVSGRQVLFEIEGTLDSSSQITITGKVKMDSDLVDYLKTLANPRYVLEVITGKSGNEATGNLQTDDGVDIQTDDGIQIEID